MFSLYFFIAAGSSYKPSKLLTFHQWNVFCRLAISSLFSM